MDLFLLDPEERRLRLAGAPVPPPAPALEPGPMPLARGPVAAEPPPDEPVPGPAPELEHVPLPAPATPSLYDVLRERYANQEAELAAAQAQDRRARRGDQLGNNVASAWFAQVGLRPPNTIDTTGATEEVKARQAALAQHLGLAGAAQGWDRASEKHAVEMADETSKRDPASNASALARAQYASLVESLSSSGFKAPDLDVSRMSAAELEPVLAQLGKMAVVGISSKPGGTGQKGFGRFVSAEDVEAIADGVVAGRIRPDLRGMYGNTAGVVAALAKRGFNQVAAIRDFKATERWAAALNSNQMERLTQAATFAYGQVDRILGLYREWQALTGGSSQWRVINRATLRAAKEMGGELGAVAVNLDAQIADLVAEAATVYKGGNSPTSEELELARHQLDSTWASQGFERAALLLKQNMGHRITAMESSVPRGVSPDSPYAATATFGDRRTKPAPGGTPSGRPSHVREIADGAHGATPKPSAPPRKGTTWMRNPKGAWGEVPLTRREEALAAGYLEE